MTSADPIRGIEYLGYTEREASFLYLVAVHSGFLLLREGNALYTSREQEKLYQQWRVKRFGASEIPVLLGAQSSAVSFRTELQAQGYPIFHYRHLPQKSPAFHSMERSPHRSAS